MVASMSDWISFSSSSRVSWTSRSMPGTQSWQTLHLAQGLLGPLDLLAQIGGLVTPRDVGGVQELRPVLGVLVAEHLAEIVDDPDVDVLAAERVAPGRRSCDLEAVLRPQEHRRVEGPAAEVVDGDGLARLCRRRG